MTLQNGQNTGVATFQRSSVVPNTVELLYKGQVGDRSVVTNTVEPLYKGQVGVVHFQRQKIGNREHCTHI